MFSQRITVFPTKYNQKKYASLFKDYTRKAGKKEDTNTAAPVSSRSYFNVQALLFLRSNLTAAAETIARIPEMKLLRASPSWVLASVSYVGISVVWLASYLTSIGRRAKSIASASVGAAGGVIAFYIGMLLIYFAIMLNIDELAGAQIPMLILAGRISPVTSGVFSILIVTGIYTASVPLLWQTAFRLAEEGSLRFRRISVLLAALGIAASLLLPFNRLMNIVYVLIGYLGFLLLACMVLKAAKIIK